MHRFIVTPLYGIQYIAIDDLGKRDGQFPLADLLVLNSKRPVALVYLMSSITANTLFIPVKDGFFGKH